MSDVEDQIIEEQSKDAETIEQQTDTLWIEYGKLQAQREQYDFAHQRCTQRMQQIHQEIQKLTS